MSVSVAFVSGFGIGVIAGALGFLVLGTYLFLREYHSEEEDERI